MKRSFTCIVCPNGCEIEAEYDGATVTRVSGQLCPKGEAYVTQELTDPRRTIATSVRVLGGAMPLASVRLTQPIPKNRILDVMAEIRKRTLTAPTHMHELVIGNVLGLGSDVIVTKNVPAADAAGAAQ